VADALLTYLQIGDGGGLTLHQRFVELDRGTARPAEQLANKITCYARLRHYAASGALERPLWRSYYRAFPQLLIVLADQSRERIRSRIQRTLALHESDPILPVGDPASTGMGCEPTRQRAGAGPESDPTQPRAREGARNDRAVAFPVFFVALEDLTKQGPFAPIFISAEHPGDPVDWLGRPL
jgi:hypothetical protein